MRRTWSRWRTGSLTITGGLNHDSVVRPNYDRAYVYAYAASYEWTNSVLDWLGGSFATRVKTYNPTPSDANDLVQDQKASVYVSEWIQNPLNKSDLDGHWKRRTQRLRRCVR
jgi:hypothetical protein